MKLTKERAIALCGNIKPSPPFGFSGTSLGCTIHKKIYNLLEQEYLENGITTILYGGSIGYEIYASMAVFELQEKYPEISLIAVLPFDNQEFGFDSLKRRQYEEVTQRANHKIIISQKAFSSEAYTQRNEFLVANSTKIYAYHDGNNLNHLEWTLARASECGVEVVNIYELI